jgi:hypothetical protein
MHAVPSKFGFDAVSSITVFSYLYSYYSIEGGNISSLC